jgi:4-alpha-glucanotransferase
MRATLERFDAVRLDHFIGLSRAWCVPAGARSARDGHFSSVPGEELLSTLHDELGGLPFVAEDLGLLTSEVEALRDRHGLPGMRVLEFAFAEGFRDYQPHRYPRNTVVYTGTHDNDTMLGWLRAAERSSNPDERRRLAGEAARALAYAGGTGVEPHWDLVRLAFASPANTAIVPLQDLLGLDTDARMNVPGTSVGNWRYRCRDGDLSRELAARLRALGETYERLPPNS